VPGPPAPRRQPIVAASSNRQGRAAAPGARTRRRAVWVAGAFSSTTNRRLRNREGRARSLHPPSPRRRRPRRVAHGRARPAYSRPHAWTLVRRADRNRGVRPAPGGTSRASATRLMPHGGTPGFPVDPLLGRRFTLPHAPGRAGSSSCWATVAMAVAASAGQSPASTTRAPCEVRGHLPRGYRALSRRRRPARRCACRHSP